MNTLFGIPHYTNTISPNLYNKQNIIEDIEYNYSISPKRNKFDDKSNIHHSYYDNENSRFRKIDYEKLVPLYDNVIKDFFSNIRFKEKLDYDYQIVNYTCMKEGQNMESHIHPDCDFTAVHYVKFKDEHQTTSFQNSHKFSPFINFMRPVLVNKLDLNHITNSYVSGSYQIQTKEDDIHITPSFVFHSIPHLNETKDHRITIVINIRILN